MEGIRADFLQSKINREAVGLYIHHLWKLGVYINPLGLKGLQKDLRLSLVLHFKKQLRV